ncbi:hypothetical protein CP03DC35_0603 [Chlamydia psittaci 03DC35]|nr:hypothetical protein G5O_0202 [Chlamydia psittaci 6BC]AEG85233.1 hypothetical protein CPS0C_0203 [Chlamydia psittaci C19/98]AEG86211.1 hypothetical protein CPS0A_0206 [Chlamydia psittaci 01DC11]AEG87185.1 hypothetical protein CPS0B_0202 [Chlamydia psittaci 02DC15]AEG88164.1 hypothetical protein CPS0D_0201 [Chlamydia psittaci 08DC60]AUH45477.1 hypothetical protein CX655_00950 [Chlamydia psittaci]EPJ31625.1 hypothetical protein CP03DC35_0603 [Chlamydia psittaci 03DC35]EPP28662.1 hypothetica
MLKNFLSFYNYFNCKHPLHIGLRVFVLQQERRTQKFPNRIFRKYVDTCLRYFSILQMKKFTPSL